MFSLFKSKIAPRLAEARGTQLLPLALRLPPDREVKLLVPAAVTIANQTRVPAALSGPSIWNVGNLIKMCAISSELKITFACRLCFRLASDGRSFGNISEQNILAAPNAFCKVKVGYLDLAACERAKALFLEPSATK